MQDLAKKYLQKVIAGSVNNEQRIMIISIPKKNHYHIFWLRDNGYLAVLGQKTVKKKHYFTLKYLKS